MTELLLTVLAIVTGLIGMPVISWLKGQLGLADKAALGLASGVSIVLGVLVCFLSGTFTGMGFDLTSIVNASTAVFAAATLFYKMLTEGQKAKAAKQLKPDVF